MAAIGLGVVALIVIAYQFLGGSSAPVAATASPNAPAARAPLRRNSKNGKAVSVEPRLDPTLDLTLLAATEQMKYAGNGRNIFVAGADSPQPGAPGNTDKNPKAVPAPPPQPVIPQPPAITLKFFGFASKPG